MQRLVNESPCRAKGTVRLNATQGNVYTEIEAIKEFADIDVFVTAKEELMEQKEEFHCFYAVRWKKWKSLECHRASDWRT